MAEVTTYLSILILNINDLTSPIKSTNWQTRFKNEDLTICCLQEIHLTIRNKHSLRVRGLKNIYQANGSQKQGAVARLLLDKVDLKPKLSKETKKVIHTNKRSNTSRRNNNY
jgi:hypothetical protein